MRLENAIAVALVSLVLRSPGKGDTGFQFVSPVPGSLLVSRETNIILRTKSILSPDAALPSLHVTGAESGEHAGRLIVSDDNKTLVFTPASRFSPGEVVSVAVGSGLIDAAGNRYGPASFQFTTTGDSVRVNLRPGFSELPPARQTPAALQPNRPDKTGEMPLVTVTISDNPSPGYVFVSNIAVNPVVPVPPYLLVIDNTGKTVFEREMTSGCDDFKQQANGMYTYYDTGLGYFVELDSLFNVRGTYRCGNGYSTDVHELRILPDGHALLMSYDTETMSMDSVVSGGQPDAQVVGLVIQELDRSGNVVFQWRSWDHFSVTDATHTDFTVSPVDYVHGNALELDEDGNIILSSRHMDEITKIDRSTGDIIWRWGGKHNEFTFVNDTLHFSHQHAIRRLPDGHFTMFDNGNYHTPPVSRALEYALDEQQKTATLVWSYVDTAGTYGYAMGYVQRLETGNTLIGWGAASPAVTEVRADGSKAFEMRFPDGIFSYRAYRFQVNPSVLDLPASGEVTSFHLQQNYPNPFNPGTRIAFSIPDADIVSLDVFNILGQKVATLVDGYTSAGVHSVVWDGSQAASGVYFYTLRTPHFVQTKKMLLLH